MAPTRALLKFVKRFAFTILLAPVLAAGEVSVTPPNASACVWNARTPEAKACVQAQGGRVAWPAFDSAAGTFVTFSAPAHFEVVLPCAELAKTEAVRLDPLPVFRWRGWSASEQPETRIEWLRVNAKNGRWEDLGTHRGAVDIVIPSEVRAVRAVPSVKGMSPRTFFPENRRAPMATAAETLRAGGEIALCIVDVHHDGMAHHRVLISSGLNATPPESVTARNGCLSIAGIAPAQYEIRSADDSFEPRRAVVREGESAWLGDVAIAAPARVRVRVNDPDPSHVYSIAVHRTVIAAGVRAQASRPVKAGADAEWMVRPGSYDVVARPTAYANIEMRLAIVASEGADIPITFDPTFVTIFGVAKRGSEPAADIDLVFQSEEGNRKQFAVSARTNDDGSYEAVLPTSGAWRVSAKAEGQRNWKPRELHTTVPEVARHEWNIALPDGSIAGKVIDAANAKGIAQVTVEARWPADGANEFVSAQTAPDGSFRFDGLPAADVTLEVNRAVSRMLGYKPAPQQTVQASSAAPPVTFALDHANTAVVLHVKDSSGRGVSSAQVFLASTEPLPALLGRGDGDGRVELGDDVPLPVTLFVVATGYPWTRLSIREARDEAIDAVMPEPQSLATQFVFTGATEKLATDTAWGLEDEEGFQVPLFFHLLRQNALPVIRGNAATLPLASRGTYRLWIKSGGAIKLLTTVILPSPSPIVVNVD